METQVYVIRHCEAKGNTLGIFQGSADLDITDMGAKQLLFLAERFKNIHIDAVFSSPLLRAYKTATAVAEPKRLPVIKHGGLTELDGGEIEGMTYADIYAAWPALEEDWTYAPQNFSPPKGESMRQVYSRIWQAVTEIVRENRGKTVVIASHGAAIRNLICRVTVGDIERLNDVGWSDNTAVSLLSFDDNMNCTAKFLNDASHLPPEFLPKKNRIGSIIKKGQTNDNNVG